MDEDHANNDPDNLAVLCLGCHHNTQLTGGFARHLDAAQVRRFRDDWIQRVKRRWDEADRLATEVMAAVTRTVSTSDTLEVTVGESVAISEGTAEGTSSAIGYAVAHPEVAIWDYVRTLPELKRRAYEAARPEWDSGVTARMVEASYQVIDVIQDILANLAARYPAGHFDTPNPRDYISEIIATRFRWHRYHHEPDGHGQNGTIIQPMVAASVMADAGRMVVEMVGSLTVDWSASSDYDFLAWRDEWDRADRPLPTLDVQVSDGKSVVVTTTTTGDPFTLILRARLAKSNRSIDHSYPYEYFPRKVGGGDVIENYTIAGLTDSRSVVVYGEGMTLTQIWQPSWQERVTFDVGLTFLAKDGGRTRIIGEYLVSVSLETGKDRLKAELKRPVGAQPSVT